MDHQATEYPTTVVGLASSIAKIDDERADLKARLKALNEERVPLETDFIDAANEATLEQVRVAGRTVFVRTQTYVKPKDGDRKRAVAALRGTEYESAIGVNATSMSSFVRKKEGGLDAMGPTIAEAFEATDKVSVQTRASR